MSGSGADQGPCDYCGVDLAKMMAPANWLQFRWSEWGVWLLLLLFVILYLPCLFGASLSLRRGRVPVVVRREEVHMRALVKRAILIDQLAAPKAPVLERDLDVSEGIVDHPLNAWQDPRPAILRVLENAFGCMDLENVSERTRTSTSSSSGDYASRASQSRASDPGSTRSSATALSIIMHSFPFGAPLMLLSRPVFTVVQISVVFGLWVFFSLLDGTERAGLDSYPALEKLTDLRATTDCVNHQREVWRWFTYQFTHVSFVHVTMNCFSMLIGVPMERFQGSVRMCVIHNVGVLGGACGYFLHDVHKSVIGMSAGNTAVFSVYFADFILNVHNKRWKVLEFSMLSGLMVVSIVSEFLSGPNVSHAAHVGGAVAGFFASLAIGRVVVQRPFVRVLRVLAVCAFSGLFGFCAFWSQQWPPRTLFEAEGWCWTRMVNSMEFFGDTEWHCVWCGDDDCISNWLKERLVSSARSACWQGP